MPALFTTGEPMPREPNDVHLQSPPAELWILFELPDNQLSRTIRAPEGSATTGKGGMNTVQVQGGKSKQRNCFSLNFA